MESELVGEDSCGYSLGSKDSHKAGPGRPLEIETETLRRNVLELQFVLEQNWGEVGWLLSRAQTEADVRTALAKIVNPRCNLLEPFTKDHTLCTETNLRDLRKKSERLRERRGRLLAELQSSQHACERLFGAWVAETDSVESLRIHSELARCAESYKEVARLDEKSRTDRETLLAEIESSEAHFAQSEILKHLHSDRRRFTPVNIARAMAGLPYISARVCTERCSEAGINPPNGVAFNAFRMIERVLKEPVSNLCQALETLRKLLVSGAEKSQPHAVELNKNWYFLETAVRSAVRDSKAPFGSLPYRVFAEYARRSSSPTVYEASIANLYRLHEER